MLVGLDATALWLAARVALAGPGLELASKTVPCNATGLHSLQASSELLQAVQALTGSLPLNPSRAICMVETVVETQATRHGDGQPGIPYQDRWGCAQPTVGRVDLGNHQFILSSTR